MRTTVVATLLALWLGLLGSALAPSAAAAQPAAPEAPQLRQSPRPPPRSATVAGKQVNPRDVRVGPATPAQKSPGLAIAFWAFAFLSVAGSVFVLTRKNLIAAVMGMVGTFFAIAALYMMLYAHFLAVIQMLVYAGAIMVLFVFVIMILNKPEDEPYAGTGRVGKVIAGLAMTYLVFRLGSVLVGVDRTVSVAQLAGPPPTAQGFDWGTTAAVGWNLFTEYVFPFEAVSVLLLIAVVGAIAIARPLKDDEVESEGGVAPLTPPSPGHHREVRGGEAL